MYPIICLIVSAVGILLFLFAGKITASNRTLLTCIKALGAILAVLGLAALLLLLTGKLTLPLSKS